MGCSSKWIIEEVWLKNNYGSITLSFSKWEIHGDTFIYRVRCLRNGTNPKMLTCTKTLKMLSWSMRAWHVAILTLKKTNHSYVVMWNTTLWKASPIGQWHMTATFVRELSIKGWRRAWHVAILTLTNRTTHVLPCGKLLYEKSLLQDNYTWPLPL